TDGQGGGPPTGIFPDSSDDIWRKEFGEFLDRDGQIQPRYGCVAIRSGGKTVLVDTGLYGQDGTLLQEMNKKGVSLDDVSVVVMTHLHPDHVGWNLTNGKPTFPNARYLVPEQDYRHFADTAHVEEQVVPLERLHVMELVTGEHKVTDELITVHTPGHTPGHISLAINSGGKKGFILGDVAHSPAQAHYTDWSPSFDTDRDLSRTTRHKVFDMLEKDGLPVSAGHFPGTGFGKLVRQGGRRIWQVI
ncbi:MAG: MBL fold metallo-hydrolase, partial [Chloroflexi bacterium]|nr:MBL fold metallo-hydrolase [Chloroflexota bacterium]